MSNKAIQLDDSRDRREGVRPAAVVAIAVAVGFLVWLLLIRGDGDDGGAGTPEPRIVSESQLSEAADAAGHPVYWAGPQPGTRYELSQPENRFYVRYVTDAGQVGDQRPLFLTVATYPAPNAFGALQVVAKKPGADSREVSGGGIVVVQKDRPQSVYLAYPNRPFQVEVFDPSAQRARQLALSGQIRPID